MLPCCWLQIQLLQEGHGSAHKYVQGDNPIGGKKWKEVEKIYGIVHLGNHWVAVCIDVLKEDIVVYDSMTPEETPKSQNMHDIVDKTIRGYLENVVFKGKFFSVRYYDKNLRIEQPDV